MANALGILAGGCDEFYNEIIKENLDQRILIFNDEVNEGVIENYILYILKWNREDKDLPIDKRTPITIILNSPGGNVFDGFAMVDVILQSKTPVKCICIGVAASMGYHILLACDERIAFKNSVLLQHDGEIAIQNSRSKARETMKFFEDGEKITKEYVLSRTKMTEEFYDKIYEQEYWMYATEAKELGCIDKIIGVDIELDDVL